MKTAREVAHAHCAEESTSGDWCAFSGAHLAQRPHAFACDRLTAAILADRRELVEACARAALPLPSDDDLEDPYHRVRALIPKEDSRG